MNKKKSQIIKFKNFSTRNQHVICVSDCEQDFKLRLFHSIVYFKVLEFYFFFFGIFTTKYKTFFVHSYLLFVKNAKKFYNSMLFL